MNTGLDEAMLVLIVVIVGLLILVQAFTWLREFLRVVVLAALVASGLVFSAHLVHASGCSLPTSFSHIGGAGP